jgi:hypothetical protein
MAQSEIYDLVIVADATASMTHFLDSLNTSLPQIISISALTGCFSRIGLLYYRDYCDTDVVEWHGWLDLSSKDKTNQPNLLSKAQNVEATGGGDWPEATKTALAKVYEVSRPDATTMVLLYTDAPPHTLLDGGEGDPGSLYNREREALSDPASFGGYGPSFVDWVSACHTLRHGVKSIQTYCIVDQYMTDAWASYYDYLCQITGGTKIVLRNSSDSGGISKVTIELLLAWMGIEKAGTPAGVKTATLPARLTRYIDIKGIEDIKHEDDDDHARNFFGTRKEKTQVGKNIDDLALTPQVMKEQLLKKEAPVMDFSQRWKTDPTYRTMAIGQLKEIIEHDVRAMALNPVFGSLWRAACNDRSIEGRDQLISSFGVHIERITDRAEKAEMKAWLEESYDYAAEIQDMINTVPEDERFPCVCLDPTLNFSRPSVASDDEDDRPISAFDRDELLAIGRSCDYQILRRLGRVLTRLTYIEKAADMQEHIAAAAVDEVPRVPMALASPKYKRQFWRVLLHVVLRGTMLAGRPAALLAALSLRMGVEPLEQAAEQEMLMWRDRWNDVEIPETWNVSCLSLLLDADAAYRRRRQIHSKTTTGLLKDEDSNVFEALIAFKVLERNLDTPLVARVGWTPQKSMVPVGPLVVCRECKYPRSVTIMGKSGKCGLCVVKTYKSDEERTRSINARVSKEDSAQTPATWVECSVQTCRAQYVVYNVEALNVRAKCHYCRELHSLSKSERATSVAPFVECTKCLNRVIWPNAYRKSSFSESEFLCYACNSIRDTVSDIETTAKQMSAENSTAWLVRDTEQATTNPFTNRSAYHTISTIGADAFISRIQLFPPTQEPLRVRGKLVQNPEDLVQKLRSQISRRHAERLPCSLCFSSFRPTDLQPSCGRRGCLQRVCRDCLSGWYGLNAAGRILNTAALSCPFCRRKPVARTLAKHGTGVHAVGNLAVAVADQGQWIYAWCQSCGFAKQYVERVCARGLPAEVNHWACDECRAADDRRELERQLQQVEQAAQDARIARNWQAVEDAELRQSRLQQDRDDLGSKTKPCPGCGTRTEKIGGCDHITCPVNGCGAHWCYYCGERHDDEDIYNHMYAVHGGYYGGTEYDDVDEAGWEDY